MKSKRNEFWLVLILERKTLEPKSLLKVAKLIRYILRNLVDLFLSSFEYKVLVSMNFGFNML